MFIKYGNIDIEISAFIANNLIWNRRFLGASTLNYNLFLIFFLREFKIEKWIIKILIGFIIFSFLMQLLIGTLPVIDGKVMHADNIILLVSIIGVFIKISIARYLFRGRNKHLMLLAFVILLVSITGITGILAGVDILTINYFKNPYLIYFFGFLFELLCFNFIITDLNYKQQSDLKIKESINQLEISRLERSALQAQMNPHFIFNCLNSIQNFIMFNDKENAMEYLAKFAKLIRQSLNASTEKKISLHDEVSMLRNYLDLEKLRFKDKFEYTITLANDVIPEELCIPPLLVQPYVENAIIHGMSGKKKGGKIDLNFFKLSHNQLQVKIRDNGAGYKAPLIACKHKSLGMSIISKRLAYNNNLNDSDIMIRPNYSSEGTEVVITISL